MINTNRETATNIDEIEAAVQVVSPLTDLNLHILYILNVKHWLHLEITSAVSMSTKKDVDETNVSLTTDWLGKNKTKWPSNKKLANMSTSGWMRWNEMSI